MKRTIIYVFLAVFCLTSFLFPILAGGSPEKPSTLEEKVANLKDSVSNLEDIVKELSFEVDETRNFQSVLKEVSYETKYNQSKIKDLLNFKDMVNNEMQPRLVKLEGKVSDLSNNLNTFQKKVLNLESTIENLSIKISTNKSNLNKLSEEVKVFKGEFHDFRDKLVSKFNKEVNRLEDKIHSVPQESLESIWVELDKLTQRIDKLEAGQEIQEMKKSLQSIQEEVTQVKGQVSDLESSLEETQTQAETTYMLSIGGLLAGVAAIGLILLQG